MSANGSGTRRVAVVVAVGLLLPVFAGGCRHAPPEVAAPPVAALGVPAGAAQLEAGRAVYLGESKCARCHHPKPVADYPTDEWTNTILPRMAKKSKLTAQEYDDVRAYILAAAGTRADR